MFSHFCCCSKYVVSLWHYKCKLKLIYTSIHNPQSILNLQFGRNCSDYDDDCKDGLVCWYDDGSGEVPGCSGTPETNWEYCIDPTMLPLQNATQSEAQLAIVAADSVEPDSDARPLLLEREGINRCEGDW